MRTLDRQDQVPSDPPTGSMIRMQAGRKIMWVALAIGLLTLPFLSLPGKYVFDTRDVLWFNPSSYLAKAFTLWHASPYLGHEQHDGIVFPMGVVVWLLRSAGLSMWVTERLWHGLLLFAAAAGTILLVDGLRGERTVIAPVSAGLAYSLTPYSFAYGLPISAVYLPYVLLPLLLAVTLKGVVDRRLVWPALFGLTTFMMGGGNGAPQGYVLVAALLLVLWAVAIEHVATFRRAATFLAWSLVFVIGLNAYWLLLLRSSEVSNALSFSEQPDVINISSSASEAVRGLGFWQFYGGDQFGPWLPAARSYVTSLPLILTGFALPIGAIVSAWRVRWRFRLYFLLLSIVSVFVAGGIFPVSSPTAFGRALLWMYDHVPGVAGLRTTYKVTAQVELGFAILAGFGLAALWKRLGAGRRPAVARGVALVVAIVVIGGNAYPLWAGKLYNPARGVGTLPFYWQQALRQLDRRDPRYRVFFAPATTWATYRWGAIKEGVVADDPALAAITPRRLPVQQRYGSNLVAALEQPYFDGLLAAGTSQLLRYLGVRFVVLQNDLDWQRSHTARPAQVQVLLRDPALRPFTSFGLPGQGVVAGPPNPSDPQLAMERTLPPVQVLVVGGAVPYVRAEPGDPIVISGDGYGLAEAARDRLLRWGPPVLYSGNLSSAGLTALLDQAHPSFLITDTNRRRVWYFTGPRAPHSYTLAAGQTIDGRDVGYQLFGDAPPSTQSVAVYPGLSSITASGYGSLFGLEPQYRPANAFDGDPNTVWAVGAGRVPSGQWIQATLDQPATISSVTITVPRSGWRQQVRRVRLEFSDGSSVTSRVGAGVPSRISFTPRRTVFVRLRIVDVGPPGTSGYPGTAVADIGIPGMDPAEMIQVPSDLFDVARSSQLGLGRLSGAPIAYLFERARTGATGRADEEAGILRRFEVPGPMALALSGSVHLDPSASDDAIDEALLGPTPVQVTSSSRLLDNPRLRGSSAFDGNPGTAWVPAGTQGQWLTIRFPQQLVDRVVVDTGLGPTFSPILQLNATFSDGSSVLGQLPSPQDGTITMTFSPRLESSITLTIQRAFTAGLANPPPVAIKEVHIPGVVPLSFTAAAPVHCALGTGFTLDGNFVPVQASGTEDDLLSGRDVSLTTCYGQPIQLEAGWHDLVARGALQPDVLLLATSGFRQSVERPALPSIDFSARGDGGFDIRVSNAKGPYYLVIGQNYDQGWHARIDGVDLGPPLVLDGYSAGWRVDRNGSYRIAVAYGPQRTYNLAVLVTGVTIVAAASIVVGDVVRRRRWQRRRRPRHAAA